MFRFCFFAFLLPFGSFAVPPEQHYRAAVRHIESGGIGYQHGYTTLEAFIASNPSQWRVTPFLDVRGHLFDDGKWAANAGMGLRTISGNRAYGINGYYDYRNTGRLKSDQIGAGFETLGELFDCRINGYLPFGAKRSAPYAAVFAAFSGHNMLVSRKYHSAMKGADAELGFHFGKSASWDFYAATGPYYFVGELAPATWGGKARLAGTYKDILTLEISDSYDRTFHNKFQGQIALSFSLGPKSKVKEGGRTCKVAHTLNSRMLQPVSRQEIIVVDTVKKNSIAIDPATGQPYYFVFVDNTSHSNGTYESPYSTLADAQNNSSARNIIYVFPGNGTTSGMNSGITLKARQKFWGSGVDQLILTTAGLISIPQQTATSPTITNTNIDTDGHGIILATDNAVSGITIASVTTDAIHGTNPRSLDVSSCTIQNTGVYAISTTSADDASISLTNNRFVNNTNGVSLTFNGTSSLTCLNNTFEGQTSVSEPPVGIVSSNNFLTSFFYRNTFNGNRAGSIHCSLTSVTNANITLLYNTITNNTSGTRANLASSFIIESTGTIANCSIALTGNTFSGNTQNSVYLHTAGAFTRLNATVSGNTMSNNSGGSAIAFATPVTSSLTLVATNNTISTLNDNGISVAASGTTTTGNITINDNTIKNINSSGNGIAVNQDFTNLALTIQNNKIDACDGTGIVSFPPTSIPSLTLNVSNNTISNCSNSGSNAASGISFDQYLSLAATVVSNTLSGNVSPSVGFGVLTSADLNPNVTCMTLTGNSSNTNTAYSLTNPGTGVFKLSPCNATTGANTGTFSTSGTITSVQSCPGAAACP